MGNCPRGELREEDEADALVWRSGEKNLGKSPPFMDDGKKGFFDDMDYSRP